MQGFCIAFDIVSLEKNDITHSSLNKRFMFCWSSFHSITLHIKKNNNLLKDEDIKLNSTVFFWPELVMQILEKNQLRLQALREKTEDRLKDRLNKFDEKLKDLLKKVEAYKTIGVSWNSERTY